MRLILHSVNDRVSKRSLHHRRKTPLSFLLPFFFGRARGSSSPTGKPRPYIFDWTPRARLCRAGVSTSQFSPFVTALMRLWHESILSRVFLPRRGRGARARVRLFSPSFSLLTGWSRDCLYSRGEDSSNKLVSIVFNPLAVKLTVMMAISWLRVWRWRLFGLNWQPQMAFFFSFRRLFLN